MHRDLIVMGASAGGLEALQQIVRGLPPELPASVLIVLHTSAHSGSLLPHILGRAGALPVSHPQDGDELRHGHVYIAPPDRHLLVDDNRVRVLQGPRENLTRPAIDPLFRSAAVSAGRRVIGVVLTGMLDDGTAGLMVIRRRGGVAIVQDPATATFSAMPANALEQVPEACVLPLDKIAEALVRLLREELPEAHVAPETETADVKESSLLEREMPQIEKGDRPGTPSAFACPDCGGVLWELEEDGFLRYRCRVGHAFTARHLSVEQRHGIETALWSALRALAESGALYQRLADRAKQSRHADAAKRYQDQADNTAQNVKVLREFLSNVNEAVPE